MVNLRVRGARSPVHLHNQPHMPEGASRGGSEGPAAG